MRTKFRITENDSDLTGGPAIYFVEYKKWYQHTWHRLEHWLGSVKFYRKTEALRLIEALEQAKF